MAKNYVQPGKILTLAAPTGGVTVGIPILIGTIFGVPLQTATVGVNFDLAVEGVWDLPKTAAQAWVAGDKIYWDAANKKVDNTPTAGFRMVGVATAIAANPSATGRVRLNEINALFEDDAIAAPASHADAGPVTLTAAELLGGIVVVDTAGAGRTYTLPTAALLVAAIAGVAVGDVVRTLIVNGADAAEDITLAAGAGGAFDANQTAASRLVKQNASKLVHVRITNIGAATEAYVVYA